MSENPKPEAKPKVDVWLQRYAWIAGGSLATVGLILALLSLITNWIIPNWAIFLVLPSIANLVCIFYVWNCRDNFAKGRYFKLLFHGAWIQQICLLQIAVCVWEVFNFFNQGGGYNIFVGCEWIVVALAWVVYAFIASLEDSSTLVRMDLLLETIKALSDADKRLMDTDHRTIDNLGRLCDEVKTYLFSAW